MDDVLEDILLLGALGNENNLDNQDLIEGLLEHTSNELVMSGELDPKLRLLKSQSSDRATAHTDEERSTVLDVCMLDTTQILEQDDSGLVLSPTKKRLFGFNVRPHSD